MCEMGYSGVFYIQTRGLCDPMSSSPNLVNLGRTQVCVHETAPVGEKESAGVTASASESASREITRSFAGEAGTPGRSGRLAFQHHRLCPSSAQVS